MQSFAHTMDEESITVGIPQLVLNVARLRSPTEGCPWFRRQTFQTLRRYLLEEVYEVLEPLDTESPEKLQEELGDLLFQIVVLSQLASERGWFSLGDVLHRLNGKIIHRNPHVFGEQQTGSVEDAQRIWLEMKSLERTAPRNILASPLDGLSSNMPALALAQAYMGRSGISGTDWTFQYAALIFEMETSLVSQPEGLGGGLGRLLFMLVDLANRHQLDAEAALQKVNAQFRQQVCERYTQSLDFPSGMKGSPILSAAGVQIDIEDREVVIGFPNRPAVRISLDVADIHCAGYSPTYTRKGWLWCAYNNALMAEEIEMGEEHSLELFHEVWRTIKNS